jgi:hypothetical protein
MFSNRRFSVFLLLFDVSVGLVDLFQNRVSGFRKGATDYLGCETLIVDTFKKLGGTGVKVSS